MTDSELLRAFVERQDDSAFDQLVERHHGMVYRVCLRELKDEHWAEDAAQGTFILLYQKAAKLKNVTNLAAWLFRSAQLVSANLRRTEKNLRRREDHVKSEGAKALHSNSEQLGAGVEGLVMEREEAEAGAANISVLYECLGKLGEQDSQAVIVYYLEGRRRAEAAELCGCSENTFKKRIGSALGKLRRLMLKRGVMLSVAGCASLLKAEAAYAAPQTLLKVCLCQSLKSVITSASASAATAGTAGATGSAVGTGSATVSATSSVALQAAAGAGKAMLVAKIKAAAGVLFLTAAVCGSILTTYTIEVPIKNVQPTPALPSLPTANTEPGIVVEVDDFDDLDPEKVIAEAGLTNITSRDEIKYFHNSLSGFIDNKLSSKSDRWAALPDKLAWVVLGTSKGDNRTVYINNRKVRFDLANKRVTIFEHSPADHLALRRVRSFFDDFDSYVMVHHVFGPEIISLKTKGRLVILKQRFFHDVSPDFQYLLFDSKLGVELRSINYRKGKKTFESRSDYNPIPDEVFNADIPSGYSVVDSNEYIELSGRVIDSRGRPVPGCSVCLAVASYVDFFTKTTSGAEGKFSFKLNSSENENLLVAPVFVKAISDKNPDMVAWSMITEKEVLDYYKNRLPSVGEAEFKKHPQYTQKKTLVSLKNLELQLRPANYLSGMVRDGSGKPVSGAKINVIYASLKYEDMEHYSNGLYPSNISNFGTGRESCSVTTDKSGFYEFRDLPDFPDASYLLLECSFGTQYAIVKSNISYKDSDPFNIKKDFTLHRNDLTVKGKLVDNYGVPVGYLPLWLKCSEKVSYNMGAITDENGNFIIYNCPRRKDLCLAISQLEPYKDQAPLRNRQLTHYMPCKLPVTFDMNSPSTEIVLQVERPENVLEVKVLGPDDKPVYGCEVTLYHNPNLCYGDRITELARITDRNGCCRIEGLGDYEGLQVKVNPREFAYIPEKQKELPVEIRQRNSVLSMERGVISLTEDKKNYSITLKLEDQGWPVPQIEEVVPQEQEADVF